MPTIMLGDMAEDGVKIVSMDISEKDVKKLKIGQTVELTVVGVVGRLEVPPDGEGDPRISIRINSTEIAVLSNDQTAGIRSLARDKDDEDEEELEEETAK